jgi:hypothetical protein
VAGDLMENKPNRGKQFNAYLNLKEIGDIELIDIYIHKNLPRYIKWKIYREIKNRGLEKLIIKKELDVI